MNALVEIDFKNPVPVNLDDHVSLLPIFNTLKEKGAVGASTFYSTWASRKLAQYTENKDYLTANKIVSRKNSRGATHVTEHTTSIQYAMEIIVDGHGSEGFKMRRFLTECLRMSMQKPKKVLDQFDVTELLSMATAEIEKERGLKEQAIRDRGKIGDSKVATAMAKASAMSRKLKAKEKEIEDLKVAVGESAEWKTVIGWKKCVPVFVAFALSDSALGRMLSAKAKTLGYKVKKIDDPRWGKVNAYHRYVVRELLADSGIDFDEVSIEN